MARTTGSAAQRTAPTGQQAADAGRRRGPQRCDWCGRSFEQGTTVGRRRRYCGQACRQRAYESRSALRRGDLPEDAVVLTAQERESLADRLFQVRCAAEDVQTAVADGAGPDELRTLLADLLRAAEDAEALH